MWETLLWLLVGAIIAFLPNWILSNRSRKWALEDRKLERANAAREIRLREGEEIIKEHSNQIHDFERKIIG